MTKSVLSVLFSFGLMTNLFGPAVQIKLDPSRLDAVGVSVSKLKIAGRQAIKITKDPSIKAVDEPTFAKLRDFIIKDGTIQISVLSRLLKDANPTARGFIGLAFRIKDDNSRFECFYLRPSNGRADDQLRRNHTLQYFSYPDFKFDRLGKEASGEYESYVDIGLDEWINLKIEIKGARARLFVNNSRQPVLIVNDLKHGEDSSGAIGLWVDEGTEGYFADLKIQRD